MVTDEEFLKLMSHVENLARDVMDLRKHEFLMQARITVLTDVAVKSMASIEGFSRETALEVIQKTVRKEYDRLLLMIGDTSPQFADAIDLDPERPLD